MHDSELIDDFVGKLSSLASKSAALGEEIEETKMVKKFLKALPRSEYIQIVALLEQVLDLNKTGFEDVVGRLKAYEERIKEEVMETQGNLLFSNGESSYSIRGENGSRGRGRGRNNRGRGRGRGNGLNRTEFCSDSKGKEKVKKDHSKVVCYRCDQMGHFPSKCPDRVQKLQEANMAETVEADAAYVHEVVFLNEQNLIPKKFETGQVENNVWYLDNGASNHMTGNRSFFSELNESITRNVRFGDGSCVKIEVEARLFFKKNPVSKIC
ncbi:uncharacterized protein LOC143578974 [Bidens hawaiensis]|uniref:uncharacterized protein LOC143578974 n=1 Tax=Bidens hawaiensis TaxID=980011 RepID=UPI00404B4F43